MSQHWMATIVGGHNVKTHNSQRPQSRDLCVGWSVGAASLALSVVLYIGGDAFFFGATKQALFLAFFGFVAVLLLFLPFRFSGNFQSSGSNAAPTFRQ